MKHPIIEDADIHEVNEVLRSGNLSGFRGCPTGQDGGPRVQSLEAAFRDYFKVKWAVSFNSATAALHAACTACDVEVAACTPFTFVASASCVLQAQGEVEWCDIDPDTFCMNTETRVHNSPHMYDNHNVIIPVHLMGHPAEMDSIKAFANKHGMLVIEDCAQAIGAEYHGRKVGTIGDCGIFSFNQSKTVSTGEGGMLITNNDWIARVARAVRNHGEVSDPELKIVGYNYRMTEYTASLALSQFKRLDVMNDHRIQLTSYMSRHLDGIEGVTPPIVQTGCKAVFYTYAIKLDPDKYNKTEVLQKLKDVGVYFGPYVRPLYHLPVFGINEPICPVAERMWEKELIVTDIFRPPATLSDCDNWLEVMKRCLLRN